MSSLLKSRPATGQPSVPEAVPARVSRPAATLALAYLAVAFPALFLNGFAATPWAMVAVHLAALGGLAWAARLPRPNVAADWLPLVLTGFFYAELPSLIAGVSGAAYHDAAVQGWERALFGAQPAHDLAGALPWLWLSEPLHLGYLAYYFLIFLPPLALYLRGRREAFAATLLAILATFVVCYATFILFPVEGPRYAWPPPPGIPDGPVRALSLWLLEGGSSRGTAFPSSHAAVAVAASVAALRYQRPVGIAVTVTSVLLVVGAVYGGFHYAIDMTAGVLVGLVMATGALRWFERRAGGPRVG